MTSLRFTEWSMGEGVLHNLVFTEWRHCVSQNIHWQEGGLFQSVLIDSADKTNSPCTFRSDSQSAGSRQLDRRRWIIRQTRLQRFDGMINPLSPHVLALSSLSLSLSSPFTTSRELLSQFSTCSEWRWFDVGEKLKKIAMYW